MAKPADERISDLLASILLTKESLEEISLDLTNSDSANRTTSQEIPAIDQACPQAISSNPKPCQYRICRIIKHERDEIMNLTFLSIRAGGV